MTRLTCKQQFFFSNPRLSSHSDGSALCRNAIDGVKPAGGSKGSNLNGATGSAANANDSFNKHYNKELKVSEGTYINQLIPLKDPNFSLFLILSNDLITFRCSTDEIPLVLLELNESALIYIQKE